MNKNIGIAFLVILSVFVVSLALILPLAPAFATPPPQPPQSWEEVGKAVIAGVDKSNKIFNEGDIDTAKRILSDTYFEKFEALGMEMALRNQISASRAYHLERVFAKIRKGMAANDPGKVDKLIGELKEKLRHDAGILDEKGVPLEGAGYVLPPSSLAETATQAPDDSLAEEGASEEKISPQEIAKEIELKLMEALAYYHEGNSIKAQSLVSDTYFDIFEGKGMEAMVAVKSANLKAELESKFAGILGLIERGKPAADVESAVSGLSAQMRKVAGELTSSGGIFTLFIASFFIIAREGFEAILVISALIAYLRRTGNSDKVKFVGNGAIAAVALSVVTAIIFMKIYTNSGASQENLEGVTMLIAAAVLFYVSYWLTSKAEAAKWMAYIQKQVSQAIGRGSMWTLGLASFIVVYREGAETILFYSALYSNAGAGGSSPIMAGFVAGCLLLAVIYYAFKYGTARIPMRPFFNVTSAILFYMSFVFAGQGVVELQIGGLIRATPVDWFPRVGFLGISPTAESLMLQGIILLAAIFALGYLFVVQPFKEQGRVLKEIRHTLGDLQRLHDSVEHIRSHAAHGLKISASSNNTEIREISDHLQEIDDYSHELLKHMGTLNKNVSMIFGKLGDTKIKGLKKA